MQPPGDGLTAQKVMAHGPGGWTLVHYRIYRASQSPRIGRNQPVAVIDRHLGAWRVRTDAMRAEEAAYFPSFSDARRAVVWLVLIGT